MIIVVIIIIIKHYKLIDHIISIALYINHVNNT